MTLFLQDQEGTRVIPCLDLPPQETKTIASPLAVRTLRLLAQNPDGLHASEIARRLREPVQKIHYHVTRLRKAGVLRVERLTDTSGASAKILRINAPAIGVRFGEFQQGTGRTTEAKDDSFLAPFVKDGQLRASIVVGSPDPHGPEGARGRDASYAIDLGVFLGTRLRSMPAPAVVLDTELHSVDADLIVIGGPVVNRIAARLNKARGSIVTYDEQRKEFSIAGKRYASDTTGIIAKIPNPFAKGRWILWIAGKRYSGTRAAILAFLKEYGTLTQGAMESKPHTRVVEGVDADSDGAVDSVRFLL